MSWVKVLELPGENVRKRHRNLRELLELLEKKVKGKLKKTDMWIWDIDLSRDIYYVFKWKDDGDYWTFS